MPYRSSWSVERAVSDGLERVVWVYTGTADLYVFFYLRALQLLTISPIGSALLAWAWLGETLRRLDGLDDEHDVVAARVVGADLGSLAGDDFELLGLAAADDRDDARIADGLQAVLRIFCQTALDQLTQRARRIRRQLLPFRFPFENLRQRVRIVPRELHATRCIRVQREIHVGCHWTPIRGRQIMEELDSGTGWSPQAGSRSPARP